MSTYIAARATRAKSAEARRFVLTFKLDDGRTGESAYFDEASAYRVLVSSGMSGAAASDLLNRAAYVARLGLSAFA